MELKEILLSLRREKGLSQAELAEELGVSRQAVSRWEAGLAVPSGENLIALSRVYGVTVEEMCRNGGGKEPPKPPPDPGSRDAPEMDGAKAAMSPQLKRIMIVVLTACIFLGTFFWGQVTNSPSVARGYLFWEAVFLTVGLITKFVRRNRKK